MNRAPQWNGSLVGWLAAASLGVALAVVAVRAPHDPSPIDGPIDGVAVPYPADRDGTPLTLAEPAPGSSQRRVAAGQEFGFVAHASVSPFLPDCALAVGPDHVVAPVNGRVRIFTKAGAMTLDQPLWGPGGFFTSDPDSAGFLFDPIALFDPHSQRFFVAAARREPERLYVTVSDDSDPNGTWYEYEYDASVLGTDTDFPGIGIDATTVYLTVKMEGALTADRGKYVVMFEKEPMLSGGTPIVTRRRLSAAFSSIVFSGATTYDVSAPAQYFASSFTPPGFGASTLRLSSIRDPQGARTLDNFDIAIPAWFWMQSVPELDNALGLENEPGHYYKHGVYRNGSLWVANTVAPAAGAGKTVVRWYEVAMNDWPVSGTDPALVQWGEIDLGTTPEGNPVSAFYTDVAVDDAGNAAFVFHRSSADEYVGIVRAYRRFDDPPGSVGEIVTWQQGTSPSATVHRWGDYVSIDEDPSEPGTFWGHAEYRDGGEWRTWVGKFEGGGATSVVVSGPSVSELELHPPRPNPFQKRSFVSFSVRRTIDVNISIHDVTGRRVRTLANGAFPAGPHDVAWNGRDDSRQTVPNGVYFFRFEAGGVVETRKVTLLR